MGHELPQGDQARGSCLVYLAPILKWAILRSLSRLRRMQIKKMDDPDEIKRLVKKRQTEEQKAVVAEEKKKSEPVYFLDSEGFLCRTKQTKDGRITVRLCNFSGEIVEENIIDDGREIIHLYMIEGKLRGKQPLPKMEVPANNFAGMGWVHKWGTRAILEPGQTIKDYCRHAIQSESRDVKTMTHYGHTGWREVNGEMVYLHANGAIGVDTGISVRLSRELQRYRFPVPPPMPDNAEPSLRASLALLDIGDRTVTLPLWCGVYLAPLTSLISQKPNFSLYAYGNSGTYKTSVAILFLSHFGEFNGIECLSNLDDSIGILEKRSFILKDTLHVVDDFHPSHRKNDALGAEHIVQRLIRGYSNRTARGRLNPDMTERGRYEPRGMLLLTAEELPTLESTLARVAVIEFGERSIDIGRLTDMQGKAPLLAQAMGSYIRWVKENMAAIVSAFPERFQALRTRAASEGSHRKLPEQVAFLGFALETALNFFTEKKILSDSQAKELVDEGWSTFGSLAAKQQQRIKDDDPIQLFTDVISTLLIQHNARLDCMSATGVAIGAGDRIGWYDSSYLYLLPTAAWHALQRFCVQEAAHFPFSRNTFFSMLKNRRILAPAADGSNTVTTRIGGKVVRVLKIIDRVVYEKTVTSVTE